jgi:hypothetical protein
VMLVRQFFSVVIVHSMDNCWHNHTITGEYASIHQRLRLCPMTELSSVYHEASRAAQTVFQKMSESGVVSSVAPENDELQLGRSSLATDSTVLVWIVWTLSYLVLD